MDERITTLAHNLVSYSCQVKTGDKVIFSKYSGTEVEVDEEKYVVVKQNDILAVIE